MKEDNDLLLVRTMWSITDALHGAATSADGLTACLKYLCDELPCEQGSVWLRDEADGVLCAVGERGSSGLAGLCLRDSEGAVGQAVRTGEMLVLEPGADRAVLSPGEEEAGFPEGALLWVPLHTRHGSFGCLQLGRAEKEFSPDELKLCKRCAAMIALDLEDKGIDALPGMKKKTIMSLRNVSKEYNNGGKAVRVLNGVSLDIYENEFLVILGESGSGKSTLLNIIGCMVAPTEGTILVDGKDFSKPTEEEMTEYRRSAIGFVFQAYNLMPTLTALENIRFISETSDRPMNEEEALAMVGLSARGDHFPSMLSGGQQQRIAIARAIAKSPRMILADEPTAALDADTGREVLMVLQNTVKEQGTTLIMVTHNAEIARIANRVIHVRNGKIAEVRINPVPLQASELSW